MTTISKVIKGVELELEFHYISGKRDVLNGPFGSSYPEEYAEVEMLAIKVDGIDIMDLLSDDVKDLANEYAYEWVFEQ